MIASILAVLSFVACSSPLNETSSLHLRDLYANLISLNDALEIQLSKMDNASRTIFVVGPTGAGKSTFINYMTGQPLIIQKQEHMSSYYIANSG